MMNIDCDEDVNQRRYLVNNEDSSVMLRHARNACVNKSSQELNSQRIVNVTTPPSLAHVQDERSVGMDWHANS